MICSHVWFVGGPKNPCISEEAISNLKNIIKKDENGRNTGEKIMKLWKAMTSCRSMTTVILR
jgi:hypothetical protein